MAMEEEKQRTPTRRTSPPLSPWTRHGPTVRGEPGVRWGPADRTRNEPLPRPHPPSSRLVIASNRLPLSLSPDGRGGWKAEPAAGGLVTALSPVMRKKGGVWVGWPGAPGVGASELRRACGRGGEEEGAPRTPYELLPVALSDLERDRFYHGFSNEVLWPLFHGFSLKASPAPGQWEAYLEVNRRFAVALAAAVQPGDLVWVHDYHLMLVARELRALGVENRLAFFLHIPFPRPDLLAAFPEHPALLRALGDFDLVGFQTDRDRRNFLEAGALVPPEGGAAAGRGRPQVGAFPISIDFDEFSRGSDEPVVAVMEREIRRRAGDRTLLLGVDRLDYTKGVPERLLGLDCALELHPELRGRLVLDQLVVPSREAVGAYADTKERIERLVADLNAKWGRDGWVPVRYRYGTWSRSELLARYRAAHIALVTPLIDGMNLVAKEYCAANGGEGVLILSAFAGAAGELGKGALLVNPSRPTSVAAAIRMAHAMPATERRARMASMKRSVRTNDVHRWVEGFLEETHAERPRPPQGSTRTLTSRLCTRIPSPS